MLTRLGTYNEIGYCETSVLTSKTSGPNTHDSIQRRECKKTLFRAKFGYNKKRFPSFTNRHHVKRDT